MEFNFPQTNFTTSNSLRDQVAHVLSEADELREAFHEVDSDHMLEEAFDLYHSLETFFRMLPHDRRMNMLSRVSAKNDERGYYSVIKNITDDLKRFDVEPAEPIALDPSTTLTIKVEPGYEILCSVLLEALEQAQHGKGKERHANDRPFTEQPIVVISEMIDSDMGLVYQVIKKMQESTRMAPDAARRERLGAIVYSAASIIVAERLRDRKGEL